MLQKHLSILEKDPYINALIQVLREDGNLIAEGLWNAPKSFLAALAFQYLKKKIVIITGDIDNVRPLVEDCSFFLPSSSIIEFPQWETLPSELVPPSPDIVGERYHALKQILDLQAEPLIVVTTVQAILQNTLSPAYLQKLTVSLKVGEELAFEPFQAHLYEMGYQRAPIAADKGEFAVRGGIIDLFPVSYPQPIRIEFWGDEIESIRFYDPISQTSTSKIEKVTILPASELELIQKQTELASLIDYVGQSTLVIFDDILAIEDRYTSIKELPDAISRLFSNFSLLLDRIEPLQKIFLAHDSIETLTTIHPKIRKNRGKFEQVEFDFFQCNFEASIWRHSFQPVGSFFRPEQIHEAEAVGKEILYALPEVLTSSFSLSFATQQQNEEDDLRQELAKLSLQNSVNIHFEKAYLSEGFVLPSTHWGIISYRDISQNKAIKRKANRQVLHTSSSEVYELIPGNLVVHFHNGIGRYLGIERKPNNNGIESEFLVIQYADKALLYVPIIQSYLVTKYVGVDQSAPVLHTLGSNKWARARSQTERALVDYAAKLLNLYAERSVKGGFKYPNDSLDVQRFENDFPYQETEDQLQAIAAIKQDMFSGKVMDRLVCGDVGYGKTEVAMRAAFKTVYDGKRQVAVLVPTTVLAMQHYDNFVERMKSYGVNVGVISRFRSTQQIKQTLKETAAGSIDILIGTHRLISKDVHFKNLGLIIIDEEQRFGVKAKEHLKTLKIDIDCLTLSATPIPRTLYMSLVGARDLSVINTPPHDRLPIKTIVSEEDDKLIQTAILRELNRNGQIYVVHNRVESIGKMQQKISKLVPHARIAVAHGQMDPEEIDHIFHSFKQGLFDILVATTLIGSGIDIPNANTLIVDHAEHFGMADLYQLRGRVGRWNRRAYAYFLTPPRRVLPSIAQKRLDALVEAGGYGGGMRLAMRDLEIRGAGDILGTEQSGHVSSVGFHLYCKLLKRTIDSLQGKGPQVYVETKIEGPFDARIPLDYIEEPSIRMEIYQRFGEAPDNEAIDTLYREVTDRFGKPPVPVKWLYHISRVRLFASQNYITLLQVKNVILHMERKQGKETLVKQGLLGKLLSPEQFEQKATTMITKSFAA
ncbi:MAG: putative transcription-repair-coupling factor [Chlamydiales bacterium]|jgi:transcription-repair coupling factor (superfamily II helicase)|nr:putative transcription-repair-coupling factor [Chlamydiales bacterium]